MESRSSRVLRLLFFICSVVGGRVCDPDCKGSLTVEPLTLKVLVGNKGHFNVTLCDNVTTPVTITFHSSNQNWVTVENQVTIEDNHPYSVEVYANKSGIVYINMTSAEIDVSSDFAIVEVMRVKALDTISVIIGWIYFAAWSISFYPQVYLNFRRKSVVGLSFDFLSYNFTGFLVYGVFNVALYWIDAVKEEYQTANPHSVIPVQLNDVVFTIHAIILTSITIFQTFIYERGNQKVTMVCWILQSVAWVFVTVILIITAVSQQDVLTWLQFVTFISYIKLGVTLIKYVPQVYMNFRRKSTEGWSIGNVLLDFTGGALSILQMFLISYNYNDWRSFFGDPTKFGLGFFSVLFDVVFIFQHYVWYRGKKPIADSADQEYLINSDGQEE